MKFARARLGVLIAIMAAMICLLTAQAAFAAPPAEDDTMSLTELRAELMPPSGETTTLPGFLKTVLKGSRISTIPVEVLAVTGGPTDDLNPASSLILFEAQGPVIDELGGIAEGMSGSPIYVEVDGRTRLVGALSYGDWFTLHGTGLATPIDAMTAVENLFVPTMHTLSEPVVTGDGLKDRVIITNDPESYSTEAKSGAIVASPMSAIYVGGANSHSGLYKRFASRLDKKGMRVIPLSAAISTGSERFETTFTAGAAITALASRGDLWVGGIGTVTYVNGNNVVAFGHPFDGDGETDYYMSNAWIDGLWPSTYIAYKLGTPGKLRGTIVEDRSTGIMGVNGDLREDSVVRAYAERTDKGTMATSTVGLPKSVINSYDIWGGIAPYSATIAAWRLFDEYPGAGSALTTTTIVASDGTGTYTIVRTNIWDDSGWIADTTGYDADSMIWALQEINAAGLYDVDIKSVEVTSSLSSERKAAEVVDIAVPGGLRHGDQTVTVSLLQRGVLETQTIQVPLSIPATTALTGRLIVSAPGYDYESEIDEGDVLDLLDLLGYEDYMFSSNSRSTLSDVIKDLADEPANNELQVTFVPEPDEYDEELMYMDSADIDPAKYKPVHTSYKTDWYLDGYVEKYTESVMAEVFPSTTTYLGEAFLFGMTMNVTSGRADFYLQYSGETSETLVDSCIIEKSDGVGNFYGGFDGLTKNATIRIVTPGNDEFISTSKLVNIKVKARVSLSASSYSVRKNRWVTLTTTVLPGTVSGSVVFERYVGGHWVKFATRPMVNSKATYRFAATKTYKYRTRVSGFPTNAPNKSRTITVTVR